jgi:hypothetical protein
MIKNKEGRVLTSEREIFERWKDYFEELMNIENPMEQKQAEAPTNEMSVENISNEEITSPLMKMKKERHMVQIIY